MLEHPLLNSLHIIFFFLVHDAKPLAFELKSDLQNKTGLEYW